MLLRKGHREDFYPGTYMCICAAKYNRIDVLRFLCEIGIRACNACILHAAENHNREMVEFLLANKCVTSRDSAS